MDTLRTSGRLAKLPRISNSEVARTANGGDCSASFCIEGSICADTGMSQVCVAQNAVNAACGTLATGLCRGHLTCVGQPTGTCQRPARAGATCDETLTSGPDCDIFRNATCENGRCVAVNWQGPNGACGGGGNLCDNRGICDPSTLRCVALPSAGQACNMGACTRNTACIGTTCQAIAGIGDTCQPGQCENERGIFCQGGTCSPLVFQSCP